MNGDDRTTHEEKLASIREAAMTVREPRNAAEIAESAGVARNTAQKYLDQLVEANVLESVQVGREIRYAPDRTTQYLNQLRELAESFAKEELTDELVAIRDDVEGWKAAYGVATPDELRASVGEADLTREERERRKRDAEDWEYFEERATMLQQAIVLYDSLDAAGRSSGSAA